MPFTFGNLLTAVQRRAADNSGGTIRAETVLDFANEGIRRLKRRVNIPASELVSSFAIFNGVYTYPVPSDYQDFISLQEQLKMNDGLNFKRVSTEQEFWQNIDAENKVCDSRNGIDRGLLVNLLRPCLSNQLINDCDTYNGNGTWVANTATSDATNVQTDPLIFMEGTGSVSFDIDVSQSVNNYAEISNSTMNAVDLSNIDFNGVAEFFAWVYLPSSTDFTSFTLRIGSDSSNYVESTVTAPFNGTDWVQGWNLLGFDWRTATTVGSPTVSAIDYALFRATYPASMTDQTGIKLDYLIARQRMFANLHYSTENIVIDGTTGAYKEGFSSATDLTSYITLDTSFTDWLTYHTCEQAFAFYKINPNKQALMKSMKDEAEMDLVTRFPSRREPPITTYMITDDIQLYEN